MKRITSLISRNFPTMEKTVIPSSGPLGISNKTPMKRTSVRRNKKNKKQAKKNSILNKVVSYLISDSYMYNPSVFPQPSSLDCPPSKQISDSSGNEEDVAIPTKGSNMKFVDFFKADSYLYSPLIMDDNIVDSENHATIKTSGEEGGDMRKRHSLRRWRLEQTTTCKTTG